MVGFETSLNTASCNVCTISRVSQAKIGLRITSTDILNLKIFSGESPQTPLTRGGQTPLSCSPPLVPSALGEHLWHSMAVPLFKSRRRPCIIITLFCTASDSWTDCFHTLATSIDDTSHGVPRNTGTHQNTGTH